MHARARDGIVGIIAGMRDGAWAVQEEGNVP